MRLFLSVFLVGMSGDFGISVTFLFIVLIYCLFFPVLPLICGSHTKLIFELATMPYHIMSESTKKQLFFSCYKRKSAFSFLLSLAVERPVDGGSGSEWASCHHPFSLLSFVKLLPVRQMLKVDFEGS